MYIPINGMYPYAKTGYVDNEGMKNIAIFI